MLDKISYWKCPNPDCEEEFITREEEDSSKIYCPFCRSDEHVPKSVVSGTTLSLGVLQ